MQNRPVIHIADYIVFLLSIFSSNIGDNSISRKEKLDFCRFFIHFYVEYFGNYQNSSMLLPDNLKYLRKKKKLSQQQLADILQIPRTTLGDYERGHTEPNIELLLTITDHFEVSVDDLLRRKLANKDLEIISNDNLKVLAISVNDDNEGNIELVDTMAEAGYLESFQDPEYIRDLPKLRFPNIPEGTYRGFEIHGDSMLPLESGSIVICSFVESLRDVKNDHTYVVASQRDGLVFKRVRNDPVNQCLVLISDNDRYLPYEIAYEDVDELWAYYAHLSFSDVKRSFQSQLDDKISDIQQKVTAIHEKYVDATASGRGSEGER